MMTYLDDCLIIADKESRIDMTTKSLNGGKQNFVFTDEGRIQQEGGVITNNGAMLAQEGIIINNGPAIPAQGQRHVGSTPSREASNHPHALFIITKTCL